MISLSEYSQTLIRNIYIYIKAQTRGHGLSQSMVKDLKYEKLSFGKELIAVKDV
jgi:hypothetical protein